MKIKLKLVRVKERGEGLYYNPHTKNAAEVRKGALLFYEACNGAIKLVIDFSYKKDEDLENAKKKELWLVIEDGM